MVEPVEVETFRQAQFGQAEISRIGIARDEERVVFLPEETGVLSRGLGSIGHHVGVGDEGGQFRDGSRREVIDHRPVGRIEVERVAQPLVVGRRGVPGQGVVAGRVVVVHGVVQGPDHGDAVHEPRHAGKVFADLDVRAAGPDRLVRTAVFPGRLRLHVEDIDLAGATPLEEEDHGLGPRGDGNPRRSRFRGLEDLRHGQAKQAHPARLEHGAPGEFEGTEAGAGGNGWWGTGCFLLGGA